MSLKCFEVPQFKIELWQDGPDDFSVVYWKQIESGLNYATAAKRLGEAIMHASACDGLLDNSEPEQED